MPKTVYVLRSTDELVLRQITHNNRNTMENDNQFSAAVFFANDIWDDTVNLARGWKAKDYNRIVGIAWGDSDGEKMKK